MRAVLLLSSFFTPRKIVNRLKCHARTRIWLDSSGKLFLIAEKINYLKKQKSITQVRVCVCFFFLIESVLE